MIKLAKKEIGMFTANDKNAMFNKFHWMFSISPEK